MSLKNIPAFRLIFATMLFAGTQLGAQCEFSGKVIDLSSNYGCGKVILSYETFDMLVPDIPINIEDGTEIQFSFQPSPESNTCSAGDIVEISCLETITVNAPSCLAGFFYSIDYDVAPFVTFDPINTDSSLSYDWDFGDGTSASGMYPAHQYDESGSFEVCLTVNGGNCDENVHCEWIDLEQCQAGFEYASDAGTVTFSNTSSGSYSGWKWELGDGTVLTNEPLYEHDYGSVDIYTVCLTVWNMNGCSSKFCDYVYSGSGDICDFTDCVLPGDTDADQKANVYDLLSLGVGYGVEGPPRAVDVATAFDWAPQYAPDWGVETINGLDYKHLDCNGDGSIDVADLEAIEINYAAPSSVFMVEAPGSPVFWLDFEWDTIVINDNTPPFFELEANLMAGTPDLPVSNLRGFALQLDYPAEMVKESGIEVDYYDNSFFGNSNNTLWLQKDRYEDDGVLDLGFTKSSGFGNGFGKVADLKFIVISDVIARSKESDEFTVGLEGVVAVTPEGAMLTLGEMVNATVVVLNKTSTTGTGDHLLNRYISVYPNPAHDLMAIDIAHLRASHLEIYNSLGKITGSRTIRDSHFQLQVADWPAGIYYLKVFTDQGIAIKRVMIR